MFFTQINQMMNQSVDITLVIRKKEGQLMVSALPKSNGLKDEAQNYIVPLTLTGTPQELDMGFMQAICRPIQKVTELLTNMSQFEIQADKAAANSRAAKELKDKEAKEAKEKKDKFDKHMKKASEFETEHKFVDAMASLKEARAFATPQLVKQVDEKIHALRMKMGQRSLFEMEQTPAPQQQQPVPVDQAQGTVQPPQPVRQPIQEPVYQQPINGNMNGGHQPIGQPVQPNGYGNGNYPANTDGQPVMELSPDPEPEPVFIADYSAHREGEYDQYPDFPGYSNNQMYNPQNL